LNRPADDPRGLYGRPGARGHHVDDLCSKLFKEISRKAYPTASFKRNLFPNHD